MRLFISIQTTLSSKVKLVTFLWSLHISTQLHKSSGTLQGVLAMTGVATLQARLETSVLSWGKTLVPFHNELHLQTSGVPYILKQGKEVQLFH